MPHAVLFCRCFAVPVRARRQPRVAEENQTEVVAVCITLMEKRYFTLFFRRHT